MTSSGKYLLWDFDGTLAHRPGQWTDTVMGVLHAAGLAHGVDRETVRPFMNAGFPATAWVVYDDVVPTLTELSVRGWRHIILSNHVPELPLLVSALGLAEYFEAIHTSGATGVEKPHSEAFRRVVATLPAGTTAWMVGDGLDADVRGAEAAGLPAILVRKAADTVVHQSTHLGGVVDTLARHGL